MIKVELARYFDKDQRKTITITVEDYQRYLREVDKNSISNFIYRRLSSRYLDPFSYDDSIYKEQYKNGFSMMASYCLLIETLQSFRNGWGDSNRRSQQAYEEFFKSDGEFSDLKDQGRQIYKNIRCGILHQGETCDGWKISREGNKLYSAKDKMLDAVFFGNKLDASLKNYCKELEVAEWDSALWDNFRVKMRKSISHCG